MKIFIKPFFSLIFLISFFSIQLFSQINLSQPIPVDPNVKIGKLSNGLTYYIQKNLKPEKKMELRLVVNTGSILEDNDQRGLAHFMEHMAFKGSKKYSCDQIKQTVEGVGGNLNAFTGEEETCYYAKVPSQHLWNTRNQGGFIGSTIVTANEQERRRGQVRVVNAGQAIFLDVRFAGQTIGANPVRLE